MLDKIIILTLLITVFVSRMIMNKQNSRIIKLEKELRNWRIVS